MSFPPLERIFAHCTNGVFFCDAAGIIRYINKAYAAHAGTTVAQATGQHVNAVFPRSPAMEVMQQGEPSTTFRQTVTSDGPAVLQVARTPVYEQGELVGLVTEASFVEAEHVALLDKRVKALQQELEAYRGQLPRQYSIDVGLERIVGESPLIQSARERITAFGSTDFPVMILGETGVGKELFAQALHTTSARASGPFISVNCSSIPMELFEAEMFGYAAGAFTGARSKGKLGLFELAAKGTLFLDEVAETPLLAQKKLLRVLEEKVIRPVGGVQKKQLDFRLVVSTNQDLHGMVEQGLFRSDLFYRLSTLTLHVPSLARRTDDIPLLIRALSFNMLGFHLRVTDDALAVLQAYHWPGNIRQLRNVIAYMSVQCGDSLPAGVESLPADIVQAVQDGAQQEPAAASRGRAAVYSSASVTEASGLSCASDVAATLPEARTGGSPTAADILAALDRCCGNMTLAAKLLGISRSGLYVKCKKLNITRSAPDW